MQSYYNMTFFHTLLCNRGDILKIERNISKDIFVWNYAKIYPVFIRCVI